MDKDVRAVRMSHWKDIIVKACSSGVSKSEWCRENNVNLRQFFYWQGVIRKQELQSINGIIDESGSVPMISPRSASHQPVLCEESSFVELPIPSVEANKSGEPTAAKTSSTRSNCLNPEIMIQTKGYQLFVGDNVSERTLRTVLKAINV
ncbi:MAG: hypothetical protein J6H31_09415 [Butyrivibrio sp.]|nr:hypothetical protein [Butyrivibrio sp.]